MRSMESSLLGIPILDGYLQLSGSSYILQGLSSLGNASPTALVLTSSGSSQIIDVTGANIIEVSLIASSVSGTTPSLTLSVAPVDPFTGTTLASSKKSTTALTTTGDSEAVISAYAGNFSGTKVQVSWAISGTTPSFTCQIRVTARR